MLKSVEEQIRKAMADGEFDNLPGRGKPLSLDAYFSEPEHLRMAHSVLKSGGFVPEEVQMFRDIDDLKTRLNSSTDAAERERLRKQLGEKKLNLTVRLERSRRGR